MKDENFPIRFFLYYKLVVYGRGLCVRVTYIYIFLQHDYRIGFILFR